MFKGLSFLIRLCWKNSKLSMVYLVLWVVMSSIEPFFAIIFPKLIIDQLMGEQNISRIILYVCSMLLGILFTSAFKNYMHTKFFIKKIDIANIFETELYLQLVQADLEQLETNWFLDIKQKAWTFLTADGRGFGCVLDRAAEIVSNVIILIGIIAIITTLSPIIVLVFLLLITINTLVNSKVKKANTKLNLERPKQERKLDYEASLFEDIKYAKDIRIYNLSGWLIKRLQKRMMRLKQFYSKSHYNNLFAQVFGGITTFAQQAVTYGYLVVNVIKGTFGIGNFTLYLNAVNSFSGAMYGIMDGVIDIYRFGDYYSAVEAYLNLPHKLKTGNEKCAVGAPPRFEFCNVSFRYAGQAKDAIQDLSLVIEAGERLSIVGENGAGKTTLVKLLLRLYEPTKGKILLNGVNINSYSYDDYMKIFSVVFQDFSLFSASVRENIVFGEEKNAEKKTMLDSSLKRSGLEALVFKLSKGIDTQVYKNLDDSGFEPSGGEAQKIAIARALYKDGAAVILDEPTAALDPRAEYELYQKFNSLIEEKTAIYISHRLSSSRFADKIAVLSNGKLIEHGTHEELLEQGDLYAELFQMQSAFYS